MARTGTPDRIEAATNITLTIYRGETTGVDNQSGSFEGDSNNSGYIELPISTLDREKEVEINEIREGTLKASGYAITAISFSGSMSFKGSSITKAVNDQGGAGDNGLSDFVYDDNGVPIPMAINIEHELNDEVERYTTVLATSDSYEVQNESETETSIDWVAMDKE
jgi:hypothetical protein